MATITQSGNGVGVTATREIRSAGLAEQRPNDEWRRMADTVVAVVDDLLLVIDDDRVSMADRIHLITTLAKDSGSLHQVIRTGIHPAGDGVRAQLPAVRDAGLNKGDSVSLHVGDHIMLVTGQSADANRLARDLVSIRADQADG